MKKIVIISLIVFFSIFFFRILSTMAIVPFHDFDEANRAEASKNMKGYSSYLVPLAGSPFLRNENLKITAKNNPQLSLYHHLERPPLYFWSMILSTSIFKEGEFAYRLPSFLAGIAMLAIMIAIVKKKLYRQPIVAIIPLLTLMLARDWWLSSQSALMDTMLSLFLFLSFYWLVRFVDTKKKKLLLLSGIGLGLAILSKGQPTVIMVFPLLYLLVKKKIKISDLFLLLASSAVIVLPWMIAVCVKFGLNNFVTTFFGFAFKRTAVQDTTQIAPVYWYARWWMESFRSGFTLFLTLFIYDFYQKNLNWEKISISVFWFFSFAFFSLAKNKVWWYVLPLIPICVYYVAISLADSIKKNPAKIPNIIIVFILSLMPIFYEASNTVALSYMMTLIIVSFFIMKVDIRFEKKKLPVFFLPVFIFSLFTVLFYQTTISPTYPENKVMGEYFQKIEQPKCLYVRNMPYEAALFYSKAEQIDYYYRGIRLRKSCNNYLLTPDSMKFKKIYSFGRLTLYRL